MQGTPLPVIFPDGHDTYVLGSDIGGQGARIAVLSLSGYVIRENGYKPNSLKDLRDVYKAECDGIVGSQTGTAGTVRADGSVGLAPNCPYIRDTPLKAIIEDVTGVPAEVENDTTLPAYAAPFLVPYKRLWYGTKSSGTNDRAVQVIEQASGNGIMIFSKMAEMGHLITGRRIVRPPRRPCACHAKCDHLENRIGGNFFEPYARAIAAKNGFVTSPDINVMRYLDDLYDAGDRWVVRLYNEWADWCAVGFANMMTIFPEAEAIVNKGSLGRAMIPRLKDRIRNRMLDWVIEGVRPAVEAVAIEIIDVPPNHDTWLATVVRERLRLGFSIDNYRSAQ